MASSFEKSVKGATKIKVRWIPSEVPGDPLPFTDFALIGRSSEVQVGFYYEPYPSEPQLTLPIE